MPDAAGYLRLIAREQMPPKGAMETIRTSGGASLEVSGNNLPPKQELLDRLEAEIAYIIRKTGVEIDTNAIESLIKQADEGLSRIFGDGAAAVLDEHAVSGLEAVVKTKGERPVLFVEDDYVDLTAPSIGTYAAGLSRLEDAVRTVCRSVGRVDDPSADARPLGYQGTAWALAEGVVATNYHVLEAIAPGCSRAGGEFSGRLNSGVAVHFGHEVGNLRDERRFPIRRVIQVGTQGAPEYRHPSAQDINFDGLDLAILELEPVPGRAFPPPIPVARSDDPKTRGGLASAGHGVFVVGYPGNARSTTPDLFAEIFAGVKSFKRLAPGQLLAGPGELDGDHRHWIITHDSSTLGGNSGSAVADYEGSAAMLLGLHFGGLHARENWAHALESLTRELDNLLPAPGWPSRG